MSLADQPLQPRAAGHSNTIPHIDVADEASRYPAKQLYEASMFDELYDMAESPTKVHAIEPVPALPPKSALRTSRLLDNLMGIKVAVPVDAPALGQTTPHDMYLSSEEEVSSSADDFSDYDCESDSEQTNLPDRPSSHEDTARIVSVVFSGKPSMIDLRCRRRPASPISSPDTGSQNTSSPSTPNTLRRLPFLNTDPYANGSALSLDALKAQSPVGSDSPPKSPLTPTQLLKGVTRGLTLAKKKSRPLLNTLGSHGFRENYHTNATARNSVATSVALNTPAFPPATAGAPGADSTAQRKALELEPRSPAVTYEDIVRAARMNSLMISQLPSSQLMVSPPSPAANGFKKGILNGLTSRRRSMKLSGKFS